MGVEWLIIILTVHLYLEAALNGQADQAGLFHLVIYTLSEGLGIERCFCVS
jgi:hypothetical protein